MNTPNTSKDHIVLVPVDFSELSRHAMYHAAKMAELYDDQITLLHIIDNSPLSFMDASKIDLMKKGINLKMDELIADINSKHPAITVNKLIKQGRVHKLIVETADELNCDTIIMGSNGEAGLEKIVGSTTSRVMNAASVPVVVVKGAAKRTNYDRIVLPIDLTKESKQKVSVAIHIAKKYHSEVHILSEFESDEFLRKKVMANLNQVETLLAKNSIKSVSKITHDEDYPGHIGKDTLTYSQQIDADLILIMTQQESGFSEFFLGSYAQQIVNQSEITVMCVNTKEVSKFYGTEGFY
jgi:nucleotide-binding universal stress UspA family protein